MTLLTVASLSGCSTPPDGSPTDASPVVVPEGDAGTGAGPAETGGSNTGGGGSTSNIGTQAGSTGAASSDGPDGSATTSATSGGSGGNGGGAGPTAAASTGADSSQGGNAGSAGTANASSTTDGGPSSSFRLLWEDPFDELDLSRWTPQTHTFAENLSRFAPENARVSNGVLTLSITPAQNGDRPYTGAELASTEQFLYGRFEARIRFAGGSGIVSSLFTFKDGSNELWNEIDIEYLGNLEQSIQYNIITTAPGGEGLVYQPRVDFIGIDPAAEFHDYAFEWTPEGVSFYADGLLRYHDGQNAEGLNAPTRLRMNCWPTNNEVTTFAGPLDAGAIPTQAHYDWVRVYAYEP